jgi:hypothetical protein
LDVIGLQDFGAQQDAVLPSETPRARSAYFSRTTSRKAAASLIEELEAAGLQHVGSQQGDELLSASSIGRAVMISSYR